MMPRSGLGSITGSPRSSHSISFLGVATEARTGVAGQHPSPCLCCPLCMHLQALGSSAAASHMSTQAALVDGIYPAPKHLGHSMGRVHLQTAATEPLCWGMQSAHKLMTIDQPGIGGVQGAVGLSLLRSPVQGWPCPPLSVCLFLAISAEAPHFPDMLDLSAAEKMVVNRWVCTCAGPQDPQP